MKLLLFMLSSIGLLLLVLTGCASSEKNISEQKEDKQLEKDQTSEHEKTNEEHSNHESNSSVKKQTSKKKDPSQKIVDNMNIDEKIAQMMFIGVKGTSLKKQEAELIRTERVGGVILLGGNIQNTKQLLHFIKSIKEANQDSHTPLMLGVDEEGGRVSRIPDAIANFPSNQYIGKYANASLSHRIGELLAQKVQAFGFNVDFAPVLDIHNNPQNRVIGDRSFGSTSERVSELGIATMKGIQSEGVIPVVKHFPGHGNTTKDSHISLPKVDKSIVEIKQEELIPFKKAIDQGADMVMVAHILYSAIDQKYPATLSKRIISDVLRNDMGFEGVVITDDMSMGAITQNYGMEEAAVLSIRAGTDMFMLTSSGNGNYDRVKKALKQAVKQGTISEESIDKSVKRILKLKKKYKLSHDPPQEVDVSSLNQKIRKVIDQIK
ncbi:beta-N-acetylhexosaminidase [Pontibacillus sp. HMF3514]|uniref:beta-N-acetylhexosaminidase n=1 Tax=Pontibacillus sp. HMF3514 TaxID=2692425 RepID=UPI00132046D8|nr:beta-N-acetylhexosaminidase [Pontibacillus sp. HMF3514]QHE52286.1 beta-N-acetylhexosaminidase [Pontibacillus sp. HMF3514]